jgi:hypothetical protein
LPYPYLAKEEYKGLEAGRAVKGEYGIVEAGRQRQ